MSTAWVPPEVDFREETLLAEACRRAGVERDAADLGPDDFREPMRRLLRALDREAKLHAVGRFTMFERNVGLLVNRLRTEQWIAKHPEILDERLEPPLVIVGLGRTGTTMLQRMIASDRRFTSLKWYESRNPAPFPELPGPDGVDPRVKDAEAEVAAMLEASPDLIAAHPMDAHAPDEEVMLIEHAFRSTNPEAFAQIPEFAAWLAEQDPAPGYAYLRRLLRFLQWQKRARGELGERWILKSPYHLGRTDALLAAFPGARIVLTHRDPVQTIPSFASLVHAILIAGSDEVDAHAAGRHWMEKFAREVRHCMGVSERHPESFVDIQYEALVANPLEQVARVYGAAELPLTPGAARAMRDWASENARDRRPVHRYTLEQFGMRESDLREAFAEYRRRHVGACEEALQAPAPTRTQE